MNLEINKLNITYRSYYDINNEKEIYLPIKVDIADIDDNINNIENIKIDIFNNTQVQINKLDSPFKEEYEELDLKNIIISYLKFIDKDLIEYDSTESLYEEMVEEYGFTKSMFVGLKNEIDYYITKIKFKYLYELQELLDYNRSFPFVKERNSVPDNIKYFMNYPLAMSMMQSGMEYNNSVIFRENIGRALMDYSWREKQFKIMYISMKNKIESFTNKYFAQPTNDNKNKQR